MSKVIAISTFIFLTAPNPVMAERWPVGPGDETPPVGNYYIQFLGVAKGGYFHDGLDLLGETGENCFSASDGFVVYKASHEPYVSGMVTGDNVGGNGTGWSYWHLVFDTMPFLEGDAVSESDYIGDITEWHSGGFHHLHIERVSYTFNGAVDYKSTDNPIVFMEHDTDYDAPIFKETEPGQMFSFCGEGGKPIIAPDDVNGKVDIVANIRDYIGGSDWPVIPYEIEWWIEGEGITIPPMLFARHSGEFPEDISTDEVIIDFGIWNSYAHYKTERDFFFLVTNTDGDGIFEVGDSLNAFDSTTLANGDYTLFVRAKDHAGNTTTESMAFTINNNTSLLNVDIIQVLDISASMSDKTVAPSSQTKIETLRNAVEEFADIMPIDEGHKFGIVKYSTGASNLVDFTPYTSEVRDETHTKIDTLWPKSSTSIGSGLLCASEQFLEDISGGADGFPGDKQIIFLITDGKENVAPMIDDVKDNIVTNDFAVYALGLGYGSGINEAKLTQLVEETGGVYAVTNDDLNFIKFYLSALALAVDWDTVVDPIGEISHGGSPGNSPVAITPGETTAIFTAFWEGADYGIDFTLTDPANNELPKTDTEGIRYVAHPQYIFYEIDTPQEGLWWMKVAPGDGLQPGDEVRYSTSVFSSNGIKLDVMFDRLSFLTGDTVLVTARLSNDSKPITGAEIDVYCDIPKIGAGNVLHDGKVNEAEITRWVKSNPDYDPINAKLQILSEKTDEKLLKRGNFSFSLYDDGKHGDIEANDGLYANTFNKTEIPGSYTFRFVAYDIPVGDGTKTTREWTRSFYNEVNSDPEHSLIDFERLSIKKNSGKTALVFAPRDKFGNYLGPGHFATYVAAGQDYPLKDNYDGTYTGILPAPNFEATGISIYLDDKKFTSIKPPKARKWSLSFYLGQAIPYGVFADNYSSGFDALVGFCYRIISRLSIVGFLGSSSFKSKMMVLNNDRWVRVSANLKLDLPLIRYLSVFFNGGPGFYTSDTGISEPGFNAGAGVNYRLSKLFTFEIGTNYHRILRGLEAYYPTSQDDLDFQQIHGGIIFNF